MSSGARRGEMTIRRWAVEHLLCVVVDVISTIVTCLTGQPVKNRLVEDRGAVILADEEVLRESSHDIYGIAFTPAREAREFIENVN